MRFSVWPNPARTPDEILDLARTADGGPWYGLWFADHYMPNTGGPDVADGDVHECWSILPAVAAVTERIRLGPLVAPTSIHHPALLANRAATIDQLSNGRFVLGLGAGWQINEHRAYGFDLDEPKVRVDRFEESIQIVRSLLDTGRTTFHGTHYSVDDAPCQPTPVQATLPILVGTGSPRMLGITARHAQEWNTWGAPALAAERMRVFRTACEKAGVDPHGHHTSVQALVRFDDTGEARPWDGWDDRTVMGGDDQIVDRLGRYVEDGVDEFIVPDFALGDTVEERADAVHRFAEQVIPQFR
ncbi:MAG: LLM class flavin-dependent oxidoreductase [Actinomycetota bacterium]